MLTGVRLPSVHFREFERRTFTYKLHDTTELRRLHSQPVRRPHASRCPSARIRHTKAPADFPPTTFKTAKATRATPSTWELNKPNPPEKPIINIYKSNNYFLKKTFRFSTRFRNYYFKLLGIIWMDEILSGYYTGLFTYCPWFYLRLLNSLNAINTAVVFSRVEIISWVETITSC